MGNNAEYQHKWYLENKERIRERRRKSNAKYYYNHREDILNQKRDYNAKNSDRRHEWEHEYRKPYLKIYVESGGVLICNKCSSVENLGIHHKDGNHNNNSFNNLECLCNSCHAKEHNIRRNRDDKGRYTT